MLSVATAFAIFTILGAASCLFLITGLSLPTWIRFGVWFVIGIAIYAVYGYRKSRLRELKGGRI